MSDAAMERDVARIEREQKATNSRVRSLELTVARMGAKLGVYAMVGGALGSAAIALVVAFMSKGH